MYKKCFCVFLITVMFLMSSCSWQTSLKAVNITNDGDNISIEGFTGLFDMFSDSEGNVYVAGREGVHVFDETGSSKYTVSAKLDSCTAIAAGADMIYAWHEKSKKLKILDTDGKIKEELDIPGPCVCRMEYSAGKLYILVKDYKDDITGRLIAYDLKQKATEEIKVGKVRDFSLYKDNKMLVLIEDTDSLNNTVILYDYNINKPGESFDKLGLKFIKNTHLISMFYSNSEDVIYITNHNCVNKQSIKDDYLEPVANFGSINSGIKVIVSGSKVFMLDTVEGKLHMTDNTVAGGKAKETLKLFLSIDNNPQVIKARELFIKKHPDIDVKINYDNSLYLDSIKKMLASGNMDYDIVHMNRDEYVYFTKENLLGDLSQYSIIKERFKEMHTGIQEICTYNKELLGVPFVVAPMGWRVNEALLKKLDIEIPQRAWTWEDFYDIAKKVRTNALKKNMPDVYIMHISTVSPPFLEQYKALLYNNALSGRMVSGNKLVNMLKIWKSIVKEELIYNKDLQNHAKDNYAFSSGAMVPSKKDLYINPPLLDESNALPVNAMQLGIYNGSKNKDIAAEFLSIFSSKEVQISSGYGCPVYMDNSLDLMSKSNLDIYKYMLSNGVQWWDHSEFDNECNTILNDFFKGYSTAEQAAADIHDSFNTIVMGSK